MSPQKVDISCWKGSVVLEVNGGLASVIIIIFIVIIIIIY
jgi:hypothetical protein